MIFIHLQFSQISDLNVKFTSKKFIIILNWSSNFIRISKKSKGLLANMFFSRCVQWDILGTKTFFGGTKTFLGGGEQRPFNDIDTSKNVQNLLSGESRRKEHVAWLMTAACKNKQNETKQNKTKQNKKQSNKQTNKQTKTKQTYLLNWVEVESKIKHA